MVRRLWQNRLVRGFTRLVRLFLRWVFIWLQHAARRAGRSLRVSSRLLKMTIRPRDPNNVFDLKLEASDEAREAVMDPLVGIAAGETSTSLLWSAGPREGDAPATSSLSLWHGSVSVSAKDAVEGAAAANRRFSYVDLLATQIRNLSPDDIRLLTELIQRLARKWLDVDQVFTEVPRRNRLDIGRTLRHNIPRYAGKILDLQWAVKEYPLPQLGKPARILVIGDVSHSMVHYASVILYFFHSLNFKFVVDSFVFSEQATHSTPYLSALGTFPEKVQRLVEGAKSWNAGTRLGSALEAIAQQTSVDENTYVLIATDGKVLLRPEEMEKIDLYMKALRKQAKQVIFLTPSVDFHGAHGSQAKLKRLGTFHVRFQEIPIWSGAPIWYGTLSHYADQIYLIRTVHDLIDMVETLLITSR